MSCAGGGSEMRSGGGSGASCCVSAHARPQAGDTFCNTALCTCGRSQQSAGSAPVLLAGCAQATLLKTYQNDPGCRPSSAKRSCVTYVIGAGLEPDDGSSDGSERTMRGMRVEVEICTEDLEVERRSAISMTSLARWNINKVLESHPDIDLKVAFEACLDKLEVESHTGQFCMPTSMATSASKDRNLCCALLAWQAKGEKDIDKLVKLAGQSKQEVNESAPPSANVTRGGCAFRRRATEAYCFPKSGFGGVGYVGHRSVGAGGSGAALPLGPPPGARPCVVSAAGLAGTPADRQFYESLVGPVIRLPTDGCRCRSDEDSRPPSAKPSEPACCASEGEKLDIPKHLKGRCMERLKVLDNVMASLRKRAAQLACREKERIRLLQRAEAAWEDMERGYQDQLQRLAEKEDEIAERASKLVMERNEYKCKCEGGAEVETQIKRAAENAYTQLQDAEAAARSANNEHDKLPAQAARLDGELHEQRCQAAKLRRELTAVEEQRRRQLTLLTDELAAQRTLTRDVQHTLHADLCALRDQFHTVAEQLLRLDDENKELATKLAQLRDKRNAMVSELDKCTEMCDVSFSSDHKKLIEKERELQRTKEMVVQCCCQVPKEKYCQAKRTPSLATICNCRPDQSAKDCSCATLKTRMMTGLLRDLFTGLKQELSGGSIEMSCGLLACLSDGHNWDKSSQIKAKLNDYFTKFVADELDIAVVTAIEHCHAQWVGESCADPPRPTSGAGGGGRGGGGGSGHEGRCQAARAWRRTQANVYQLSVQLCDLKRESIKKEDLRSIENNLAKIVRSVAKTKHKTIESEVPKYNGLSSGNFEPLSQETSPVQSKKMSKKIQNNEKSVIRLKNSLPSTKLALPDNKGNYSYIIQKNCVAIPSLTTIDLNLYPLDGTADSFISQCSKLMNSVSLDGEYISNQNIVYIHRVDTTVNRNQEGVTLDDNDYQNTIMNVSENPQEICNCDYDCHCFNRQPSSIDINMLVQEMMESRKKNGGDSQTGNQELCNDQDLRDDGLQKDVYNELIKQCMRSCEINKASLGRKSLECESGPDQENFATRERGKIVNVMNTRPLCSCSRPSDVSKTEYKSDGIQSSPDPTYSNNAKVDSCMCSQLKSTVNFQAGEEKNKCKCEPECEDLTTIIGKYIGEVKSKICKSLTSLFTSAAKPTNGDNTRLQVDGTQTAQKYVESLKSVKKRRSRGTSKSSSKKSLTSNKSKTNFHKYCVVETPQQHFCDLETPRNKTKYGAKAIKIPDYSKKNIKNSSKPVRNNSKKINKSIYPVQKSVPNKKNVNEKIYDQTDCPCGEDTVKNEKFHGSGDPKEENSKKYSQIEKACVCPQVQKPTRDQCVCTENVTKLNDQEEKKNPTSCSCQSYLKELTANMQKNQTATQEWKGCKLLGDLYRGGLAYGRQTTKSTQFEESQCECLNNQNEQRFSKSQQNLLGKSGENGNIQSNVVNVIATESLNEEQHAETGQSPKRVSLQLDENQINKSDGLNHNDSSEKLFAKGNFFTNSKDFALKAIKSLTQVVSSRLNLQVEDDQQCVKSNSFNHSKSINRNDDGDQYIIEPISSPKSKLSSASNEDCVCCFTKDKVELTINELEINAFQLLKKYVHSKMKKLKCACCPHDEEAFDETTRFANMLEKVQDLISTDMKRLACHCREQCELEMNETMTFSLLEEYIRSKIKELKCSCPKADQPEDEDPCATTLASIKDIIQNDLAELSCCCKTEENECVCVDLEPERNKSMDIKEEIILHIPTKPSWSAEIGKKKTVPYSYNSISSKMCNENARFDITPTISNYDCGCGKRQIQSRESAQSTQKCMERQSSFKCCALCKKPKPSKTVSCGCSSKTTQEDTNYVREVHRNQLYGSSSNYDGCKCDKSSEKREGFPNGSFSRVPYMGHDLDCSCNNYRPHCSCAVRVNQKYPPSSGTDHAFNCLCSTKTDFNRINQQISQSSPSTGYTDIGLCSCQNNMNPMQSSFVEHEIVKKITNNFDIEQCNCGQNIHQRPPTSEVYHTIEASVNGPDVDTCSCGKKLHQRAPPTGVNDTVQVSAGRSDIETCGCGKNINQQQPPLAANGIKQAPTCKTDIEPCSCGKNVNQRASKGSNNIVTCNCEKKSNQRQPQYEGNEMAFVGKDFIKQCSCGRNVSQLPSGCNDAVQVSAGRSDIETCGCRKNINQQQPPLAANGIKQASTCKTDIEPCRCGKDVNQRASKDSNNIVTCNCGKKSNQRQPQYEGNEMAFVSKDFTKPCSCGRNVSQRPSGCNDAVQVSAGRSDIETCGCGININQQQPPLAANGIKQAPTCKTDIEPCSCGKDVNQRASKGSNNIVTCNCEKKSNQRQPQYEGNEMAFVGKDFIKQCSCGRNVSQQPPPSGVADTLQVSEGRYDTEPCGCRKNINQQDFVKPCSCGRNVSQRPPGFNDSVQISGGTYDTETCGCRKNINQQQPPIAANKTKQLSTGSTGNEPCSCGKNVSQRQTPFLVNESTRTPSRDTDNAKCCCGKTLNQQQNVSPKTETVRELVVSTGTELCICSSKLNEKVAQHYQEMKLSKQSAQKPSSTSTPCKRLPDGEQSGSRKSSPERLQRVSCQGSPERSQPARQDASPREISPMRTARSNLSSKNSAESKSKCSQNSCSNTTSRNSSPSSKAQPRTLKPGEIANTCNCNTVPLCQVKNLVKDIEGKLKTDNCTCEMMSTSVCRIHGKRGKSRESRQCSLCGDRVESRKDSGPCSICRKMSSNLQNTPGGSQICNLCNNVGKP